MVDPLTLSAIGAVAITEGIKFLYGQAGEILKRWRERKDADKDASTQQNKTEPVNVKLPVVFEGQLSAPQIHFDAVERVQEQLRGLRGDLADYADEVEVVDIQNVNLLQRVDALRQLLEAVYQQRLTFKGEQRPPSGPVVEGHIDVEEVGGYSSAVRARQIVSGSVKADAKARRVEQGGQFIGLDTDIIGG
ncbi:MAG: hypothetical protein ACJ8CB_14610 [Ktedonobacteraceae bacterium]